MGKRGVLQVVGRTIELMTSRFSFNDLTKGIPMAARHAEARYLSIKETCKGLYFGLQCVSGSLQIRRVAGNCLAQIL